jgi:DNA-binding response OmpR family regulator
MDMQVLIVEDDAALGLFLEKGLKLEGHEVERLEDGEAALERLGESRPDLLVLDLSLPKRDGVEVLEQMQGAFDNTAVLVLTGRGLVEERVRCLDLGADDFLLKPFSFHELIARCRALLRRRERFADPVLRHGELELNRMDRSVRRNGRAVELTAKEFALLEYMMQRKDRCCGRAELLTKVWQMPQDACTNVVDVYVNYLRKKLGAADVEGGDGHSVIETVRGEGYRISTGGAAKKQPGRAPIYIATSTLVEA